ncbi:ATP-binding SpoIIE family protein phosphatase [Actinacidiphila soli]|uniref:ATP-binding SpoIIE family protein phosphatase n=1 Tax=Actinacidiphila soli TaxID=2487275 RepID=UPI0013E39B54|nr:ATP-binding SpoIIE family protein phosphatase [Actinacidiphila soli]
MKHAECPPTRVMDAVICRRAAATGAAPRTACVPSIATGGTGPTSLIWRRGTPLTWSRATPRRSNADHEAAFLRVLDSGVPLVRRLVRGSLKPGLQPDRAFHVSAFRLQDPHDAVLGLAAVVADVTEYEEGRRRAVILSRGREKVGRTLDVDSTCRDLAEVVVPAFADLAVVDVVEAIVWGDEPAQATSAARVPLRRAASAGVQDRDGYLAATAMGQLRTAIHTLAALDLEADDLLARLNDTVLQLAEERHAQPAGDCAHGESLTAAYSYALYDPVSCTCIAGRSGLPGLYLACPDGTVTTVELPNGPLLGSTDIAPFAATTLDISEGTVLALATPALLDAVGTERLRQLLSHRGASMQELCDKIVYASRLGQPTKGDAILVLALANTLPTDRTTVWSIEADQRAPAWARAQARSWLTKHHVPEETVFAAEVIVSELVTNAVRYGAPPLSLRLILDRTLTAEVTDTSATSPHLRHARATDEGGRGLFIIAQLADRWGTRPTPRGKTIWAEMPTAATTQS